MKYRASTYLLIAMTSIIPLMTYAQDSGIVTCGPQQGRWCELKDLFGLLVGVYNFLLGSTGIVAFGFLIYGGLQMFLFSVDEEHIKHGKSTVIQALIGLAVIALAYVIVNTLLMALGLKDGATSFFDGSFFGN